MTSRGTAVTVETEAVVEGALVLEIEDATREQIADTLATLFLAVLEREAAQERGPESLHSAGCVR